MTAFTTPGLDSVKHPPAACFRLTGQNVSGIQRAHMIAPQQACVNN